MIRSANVLLILLALFSLPALAASPEQELIRQLTKRPQIERIEIDGNVTYDDKKIKSKMYSNEDGFWQGIGLMRSNRYTKAAYERDRVLLDYFYKSEGFDDAVIDINLVPANKPEKTIVRVSIIEGIRYRISRLDLTGDVGAEGYNVAVAARGVEAGNYLNSFAINDARAAVKTIFANKGYPYNDVIISVAKNSSDSTAALTLNVVRNQLALFGDIIIDTNLTTQPRVFTREISFKKGDIYTRDKYFESQQRLIRTGLFNFVNLRTAESMSSLDSLQPDFYVSAVERPPRYIGIGVGAGQDKDAGVAMSALGRFGDRNISGSARKVGISLTTLFTVKDSLLIRPEFEFSYTEPYLFKTRLPLILTFQYEPRATSPKGNYRVRSFSFDATAVREFSLKTKLSTSLNYEEVNLFVNADSDSTPDQIKESAGISISRRLILLLERDARPIQSRFNPSSGSYTSYRFEYVGGILGGDNDFMKFVWSWSKYNLWGRNTIFASRVRLGYVNEFGASDEVPLLERFYLGGAYTIRGFPENEFGPHELTVNGADTTLVAVGGEGIFLLNLELRKPLLGKLWGSYFIDT
ncbi:MAG: BamA/TamA family outer membrane protein, partial [Candidatus Zixiibacteriota bacterium]